jgi:predicted kinase
VIVLLNGAFGIGKTTVARRLRRKLPRSAIFDPELVGVLLHQLPTGRRASDFQDLPAWRRLTVGGVRASRLLHRTVIVPMAFTRVDYLDEVRDGVRRADPDVRHFCLTAPIEVVRARLIDRGADPDSARHAWQFRRAAECCAVHSQAEYAEHVPAADRGPDAIARDILDRLAVR